MTTALLFIASLLLVVIASELFTNAIEWAGYLLKLGTGATGSLLAALGTSLPETVVPVVALATHSHGADKVATGAVLGSPFLLLTLGAGATGIAVVIRGGARRLVHRPAPGAPGPGRVSSAPSPSRWSRACCPADRGLPSVRCCSSHTPCTWLRRCEAARPRVSSPEPLHIVRWRPGEPHPVLVTVQLLIAIGLLVVGSQLFVTALDQTASALQIPQLVLALVIVPVATELPETLNSVLWVRTNDDMLAFGNVAGLGRVSVVHPRRDRDRLHHLATGLGGAHQRHAHAAHRRLPPRAALARSGARRAARPCRCAVGCVRGGGGCDRWTSRALSAAQSNHDPGAHHRRRRGVRRRGRHVPQGRRVRAQRAADHHRHRARRAGHVQRRPELLVGHRRRRGGRRGELDTAAQPAGVGAPSGCGTGAGRRGCASARCRSACDRPASPARRNRRARWPRRGRPSPATSSNATGRFSSMSWAHSSRCRCHPANAGPAAPRTFH